MTTFAYYRVELKRLALSRFTWIAALLSLLAPLFGYWMPITFTSTLTGLYIANPVLMGTIAGALIWAVLTLIESNRIHRAGTGMLIDAVTSPISMAWVRLAAILTFAAGVWLVCLLVYMPYTIFALGSFFNLFLYVISFLVLMLPTWWIAILLASALSQIARRIELAGLIFAGFVIFSFSPFVTDDYFFRWINPIVWTFSDGFSSLFFLRIAFYTRLMWLALAGGLWVFSLLCIRRYQKNLFGSFLRSMRKVYLPIGAGVLIVAGSLLWIYQPFVDHGPEEFGWDFSVNTSVYSMISDVTYRFTPRPATGRLHGVIEYTSTVGGRRGTYDIWFNPGYRIISITYDGQPAEFHTTDEIIADARRTDFIITENDWEILIVEFEGFPTIIRAFAPSGWGQEINNTNITLSNHSTIPRVEGLIMPESFNLELTLPDNMIPVINHRLDLMDYEVVDDGTKLWTGRIRDWFLRINAGDYIVESFEAAGMDVDFIFSQAYAQIMYDFEIPQAIAEVLDFFTERLGRLHWAHLPSLSMLQSTALMFGGIAGPGFVEWGEFIFTQRDLDNPLQGTNTMEVFIHEMVHMWWGGLGVMAGWPEDGDLWSDEGLTVYYTYRFFYYKFGAEYAGRIVDAWQAAVDIQNRCFYSRNPNYFERLPERYRAQINMRNRSTNLYARMPLMILRAEELVGGQEAMDELMSQVQWQFAGSGRFFTLQDFLDAVGLTEEDISLG
ncbi:MAG: hypothetical protein FWC73_01835 [Defluviitaleaceae bacterium]|nr:hypothetical protein [Defluviitaleaceae bacterium]